MATTAAVLEIAVRASTAPAVRSLAQMDQKTRQAAQRAQELTGAQTKQASALRSSEVAMKRYGTTTGQASSNSQRFERSSKTLGSTLKGAAKGAAVAAAGYIGISQAKDAIDVTLDLAKATKGLTSNLRLSAETAGAFSAEAQVRGADSAKLTMMTKTLANALVSAKSGAGAAADAFGALGLTQKELQTQSMDKTFFDMANGAKALGDGAERTQAMGVLLGRSFGPLKGIFTGGAAGMKELFDKINDADANVGKGGLKGLQEMIEQQRQIKRESLGLQVAFTENLAPALIKIMQGFGWVVRAIKNAVGWFNNLGGVIGAIAHVKLLDLIPATKKVIGALGGLGSKLSGVGHLFRDLGNVAVSAFNSIKGPVVSTGKAIVGVLAKIVRVVASVIQAFSDLKDAPGNLLDKGTGAISDAAGSVTSKLGFQKGGRLVGGHGSGDKVPALLEPGEVVWNREAVKSLGGPRRADVMNRIVPRFAGGGVIGAGVGQAGRLGVDLAAMAGKELLRAIAKKSAKRSAKAGGGAGGYTGPPANMQQLGNNSWVDSHTLAVAAFLTHKFGLSIGSGYRSPAHNAAVGGVPNSLHTHGSPANPGAIDFSPPNSAALAFARSHIAGLQEAMIHDVGSGLHIHLGFFQKGGIVGDFARAIVDTKAPHSAALALMMAGYAESGMRDLGYGDSSSEGALQLLASTASSMGLDPHDEYGVAKAFLTRGYYKYGSAIGMANLSPATIATRTQGNATGAGVYSAERGRAVAALRSAGLKWGKDGRPFFLNSKTPKVPKMPKTEGKTKKGQKGQVGGKVSDALQLAADTENARRGSLNELGAAANLTSLQRYQVGASQNPVLGLARPGAPSLSSPMPMVVVVEDGAVDAKRIKHLSGREAKRALKRSSRRGRRKLPSAGGG